MADSGEREQTVEGGHPRRGGRIDRWHLVASLLFIVAALITFRDVLETGPMSSAMVSTPPHLQLFSEADVVFEAWLTARNARTLMTAPHQIFETPHCAPANQTLTLGVPMITMGLLAIPVAFFTENPALAYNFSTFLLLTISALAMYLLVRDWTGVPAAGVVAGILYAFNPVRLTVSITHPSVWDSAWFVFALFFSRRLFAYGRWRDAIGLALACSLQIAASFYPLLAAALMAPAFAIWLIYQYGFRKVRTSQLIFVLATVGCVAAVLLSPYLDARNAGEIGDRTVFLYVRWSDFLPAGGLFMGWAAITLGLVGLVVSGKQLPRQIGGDPRWALIVGALATTAIAAGHFNNQLLNLVWSSAPFQIPNLYQLLANFVPGLDSIRGVNRLSVALLVAVCILSGTGAAWLIGRSAKYSLLVGTAMIALAMLSIIPEAYPRETVEVLADPQEVHFYEQLDAIGNRGPLMQVPILPDLAGTWLAPKRILSNAYHHRRVSTCFASFTGLGRAKLGDLAARLPEPSAVEGLRELGFTTLILDRTSAVFTYHFLQKMKSRATGLLPVLLEDDRFSAYDLRPLATKKSKSSVR